MRTLGIIGGLSWFATSVYYRTINELVNQRLGGSHSAHLLLHSIDFEDFKVLQEKNEWVQAERLFTESALTLQRAGADCILLAANTPHLVADAISIQLNIPLLHIAEATAKQIQEQAVRKVGLLGTKFVMENAFFRDRLATFGIETLLPPVEDRDFVHASIFNELTRGIFTPETSQRYRTIIRQLQAQGAAGIVFGCTEISLLLNPQECGIPVFDTTAIHARAAVDFALAP